MGSTLVKRKTVSSKTVLLIEQIRLFGWPVPKPEHYFHPTRRWRFDLAWPSVLFAVEVEGGVWIGGRHVRGTGVEDDCEKYAEALCLGWRVLRVTSRQVKTGQALGWINRALTREGWHPEPFTSPARPPKEDMAI